MEEVKMMLSLKRNGLGMVALAALAFALIAPTPPRLNRCQPRNRHPAKS
ncbi:secreted protein [Rhodopirellula europaea SH398]|uniref:Secreted protein n=1 Tax=Rhodopirellula europaea SH398 TaxID=1263868 RepID=M5RZC9_9BACT|nr:secreted protein [Rhodopirellula europaea SH398]